MEDSQPQELSTQPKHEDKQVSCVELDQELKFDFSADEEFNGEDTDDVPESQVKGGWQTFQKLTFGWGNFIVAAVSLLIAIVALWVVFFPPGNMTAILLEHDSTDKTDRIRYVVVNNTNTTEIFTRVVTDIEFSGEYWGTSTGLIETSGDFRYELWPESRSVSDKFEYSLRPNEETAIELSLFTSRYDYVNATWTINSRVYSSDGSYKNLPITEVKRSYGRRPTNLDVLKKYWGEALEKYGPGNLPEDFEWMMPEYDD